MSDYKILYHFKEFFLVMIESQFLEIDNSYTDIANARALILLFKVELPQVTCSSMLAYMKNTMYDC